MLVLSRKIREEIQIGERIKIKVLSINKNKVLIGVEAPENEKILRTELINVKLGESQKLSAVQEVAC